MTKREKELIEERQKLMYNDAKNRADMTARSMFGKIRDDYYIDLKHKFKEKEGDTSYRGAIHTAAFMENYGEIGYSKEEVNEMTEPEILANAVMYNVATGVAGDTISFGKKGYEQSSKNAQYALDVLAGRKTTDNDGIKISDANYEEILYNMAGIDDNNQYFVRSFLGEDERIVNYHSQRYYDHFGSADDIKGMDKVSTFLNNITGSILLRGASRLIYDNRLIEGTIEEENMGYLTGNDDRRRLNKSFHNPVAKTIVGGAATIGEMALISWATGGIATSLGASASASSFVARSAIVSSSIIRGQVEGKSWEYGLGEEYTKEMARNDFIFDGISMIAGMAGTDMITDAIFAKTAMRSFGKTFSSNMTKKALIMNTLNNVAYGAINAGIDVAIDQGIYSAMVGMFDMEMGRQNRMMFGEEGGDLASRTIGNIVKRIAFRIGNKTITAMARGKRGNLDVNKGDFLSKAWYDAKAQDSKLETESVSYRMAKTISRWSFALNDAPQRLYAGLINKGILPKDIAKSIANSLNDENAGKIYTSLLLEAEDRNNWFSRLIYRPLSSIHGHKVSDNAEGVSRAVLGGTYADFLRAINARSGRDFDVLTRLEQGGYEFKPIIDKSDFDTKLNNVLNTDNNYSGKDKYLALGVFSKYIADRAVPSEQLDNKVNYVNAIKEKQANVLSEMISKGDIKKQSDIDELDRNIRSFDFGKKRDTENSEISDKSLELVDKIYKEPTVGLVSISDTYQKDLLNFSEILRTNSAMYEKDGARALSLDKLVRTLTNPSAADNPIKDLDVLVEDLYGVSKKHMKNFNDIVANMTEMNQKNAQSSSGLVASDLLTLSTAIKWAKVKSADTLVEKIATMIDPKNKIAFNSEDFTNALGMLNAGLNSMNNPEFSKRHAEFFHNLRAYTNSNQVAKIIGESRKEKIDEIVRTTTNTIKINSDIEDGTKQRAIAQFVYSVIKDKGISFANVNDIDQKNANNFISKYVVLLNEATSDSVYDNGIKVELMNATGDIREVASGHKVDIVRAVMLMNQARDLSDSSSAGLTALYGMLAKKYAVTRFAKALVEKSNSNAATDTLQEMVLKGTGYDGHNTEVSIPGGKVIYDVANNNIRVVMNKTISNEELKMNISDLFSNIDPNVAKIMAKGVTPIPLENSRFYENIVIGNKAYDFADIQKAVMAVPGVDEIIRRHMLLNYSQGIFGKTLTFEIANDIKITLAKALGQGDALNIDKKIILGVLKHNNFEQIINQVFNKQAIKAVSSYSLSIKNIGSKILKTVGSSADITRLSTFGNFTFFSVSKEKGSDSDLASVRARLRDLGAIPLGPGGSTADGVNYIILPRKDGIVDKKMTAKALIDTMIDGSSLTKGQRQEISSFMSNKDTTFSFSSRPIDNIQLALLEKILPDYKNLALDKYSGSTDAYFESISNNFIKVVTDSKYKFTKAKNMFGGVAGYEDDVKIIDRFTAQNSREMYQDKLKREYYNLREIKEFYKDQLTDNEKALLDTDSFIVKKDNLQTVLARINKNITSSDDDSYGSVASIVAKITKDDGNLTGIDSSVRNYLDFIYGSIDETRESTLSLVAPNEISQSILSAKTALDRLAEIPSTRIDNTQFISILKRGGARRKATIAFEEKSLPVDAYKERFKRGNTEENGYESVGELLTFFLSIGASMENPTTFSKRMSSILLGSNLSDKRVDDIIKETKDNSPDGLVVKFSVNPRSSGEIGAELNDGEGNYGYHWVRIFEALNEDFNGTGKIAINGISLMKQNSRYRPDIKANVMEINLNNLKIIDPLVLDRIQNNNMTLELKTDNEIEAFIKSMRFHQEIDPHSTRTGLSNQKQISAFASLDMTTSKNNISSVEFLYKILDIGEGSSVNKVKKNAGTEGAPVVWTKLYGRTESRPSNLKYRVVGVGNNTNRGIAVSDQALIKLSKERIGENTGMLSSEEERILSMKMTPPAINQLDRINGDDTIKLRTVVDYLVKQDMIAKLKDNEGNEQLYVGLNRSPNPSDSHFMPYAITEIYKSPVAEIELSRQVAEHQGADFDGDTGTLFGVSANTIKDYVVNMVPSVSYANYSANNIASVERLYDDVERRSRIAKKGVSFTTFLNDNFHLFGTKNSQVGGGITSGAYNAMSAMSAYIYSDRQLFKSKHFEHKIYDNDDIDKINAPEFEAKTDTRFEKGYDADLKVIGRKVRDDFKERIVLLTEGPNKTFSTKGSFLPIDNKVVDITDSTGKKNIQARATLVSTSLGLEYILVSAKNTDTYEEVLLDIIGNRFQEDYSVKTAFKDLVTNNGLLDYVGSDFTMSKVGSKNPTKFKEEFLNRYNNLSNITFDKSSRIRIGSLESFIHHLDGAFTSASKTNPMGFGGLDQQSTERLLAAMFVGSNIEIHDVSSRYANLGGMNDFRTTDSAIFYNDLLDNPNYSSRELFIDKIVEEAKKRAIEAVKNLTVDALATTDENGRKILTGHRMLYEAAVKLEESRDGRIYSNTYKLIDEEISDVVNAINKLNSANKILKSSEKDIEYADMQNVMELYNAFKIKFSEGTADTYASMAPPLRAVFMLSQNLDSMNTAIKDNETLSDVLRGMLPANLRDTNDNNVASLTKLFSEKGKGEKLAVYKFVDNKTKTIIRNIQIAGRFAEEMDNRPDGFNVMKASHTTRLKKSPFIVDESITDHISLADNIADKILKFGGIESMDSQHIIDREYIRKVITDLKIRVSDNRSKEYIDDDTGRFPKGYLRRIVDKDGKDMSINSIYNNMKANISEDENPYAIASKQLIFTKLKETLDGKSSETFDLLGAGLTESSLNVLNSMFKNRTNTSYELKDLNELMNDLSNKNLFKSDENLIPSVFMNPKDVFGEIESKIINNNYKDQKDNC
ncbi:MAG: hypothetical protein WC175_01090 [Candidatus Dojkabacteria bacterium]